jgi:hypothetical protein
MAETHLALALHIWRSEQRRLRENIVLVSRAWIAKRMMLPVDLAQSQLPGRDRRRHFGPAHQWLEFIAPGMLNWRSFIVV